MRSLSTVAPSSLNPPTAYRIVPPFRCPPLSSVQPPRQGSVLLAVSPKESDFEAFDYEDEADFLRGELAHLKDLEDLLAEFGDMEDDDMDEEQDAEDWDEETLAELFDLLPEDDVEEETTSSREKEDIRPATGIHTREERIQESAAADLENALLQGVVPVSAGVGDDQLPGDYDFDPLNLSTKDYFRDVQSFLLKLIPGEESSSSSEQAVPSEGPRPRALILRDYREAEIRHGRLAMLAAVFWPLQEMLDQLLLDDDLFGPLLYGPVTLPYFPLLMTAIMLLLGYLDIYSQAIKDRDSIGEAFLPADCFWDPLQIMEGGSDRMKRNMQERELLNGRMAMIAFAAYLWEEGITHRALIDIPTNMLLLRPAFQVPFIQQWLDDQFVSAPTWLPPDVPTDSLHETLEQLADAAVSTL